VKPLAPAVRVTLLTLGALTLSCLVGSAGCYVSQPSSFRVSRARTIAASREAIMAQLTDVTAIAKWWSRDPRAPAARVTTSPVTTGNGAWIQRDDPSGSVRMTITRITERSVELETTSRGTFGGGAGRLRFELSERPTGTEVTSSFETDLHGLARAAFPFVHLEQEVGGGMEQSLGGLAAAVVP